MSSAEVFDPTRCRLGEGPLWHPLRNELIWFDILGRKLLRRGQSGASETDLPEIFSAAGWVDADRLLLASETGLSLFDLGSGEITPVLALEADQPLTRSNDGRADPQGGFWIGTMGKRAEPGLGAIYRYYRGNLRKLFSGLTIPNSICFSPDGRQAYFADTSTQKIQSQRLDADGWPVGAPTLFVDLAAEGLHPDGSIVDAAGWLWNAQWGAGRVAAYDPTGTFQKALDLPARQTSCPAFAGPDLADLICTTAAEGLKDDGSDEAATQGKTYIIKGVGKGKAEPQVLL